MKKIPFIVFCLITPFVGAQIDSLKLAEQYHKSADSLYHLGDYMEAYNKESWALTLQGNDGERFSPFYKTLDSLVRYVVSDTTKYEHYLGYARKFLAEGDVKYAYLYYNSALHYLPLADHSFEQELDRLIFTLPTDTVYATPQKHATQLYYLHYPPYRSSDKIFTPLAQLAITDTLHLRKDSSLFSGVYIYRNPLNTYDEFNGYSVIGYSLHVYHYYKGVQQDYTVYNHTFIPKNFTQQVHHADSAFQREIEPYGEETYLESIVKYGEGRTIRFSPEADTLYHSYTDKEGVFNIYEFYPTGDTLSISKNFKNDDGAVENQYKEFNTQQKIMVESYDYQYSFKDTSYYISYTLNEKRDTIRFYNMINGQICGRHIKQEFTPDGSQVILKTFWDNGQLVDFLIDSAIFIGYNNKIISEEEFIHLLFEKEYPYYYYRIETIPKEFKNKTHYKYLFFLPGQKRPSDNWKTRSKRAKKIIKKHNRKF